jgi:hypothetical protein
MGVFYTNGLTSSLMIRINRVTFILEGSSTVFLPNVEVTCTTETKATIQPEWYLRFAGVHASRAVKKKLEARELLELDSS